MALYLAVANRKGGVGKSTVSVMLAHSLSTWGAKRVLVVDIDSQCNASIILLGGRGWREARDARKTISDYFVDCFRTPHTVPETYLVKESGDIVGASGRRPVLDLLPGSLLIDEVQGDLFLDLAGGSAGKNLIIDLSRRLGLLLRRWDSAYDVVIMDCAPGLSFVTHAAIAIADRVIVPFRPDYVSLMAIDRISLVAEGVTNLDELSAIPLSRRRYLCLPNFVRGRGAERLLIEEVGLTHPLADVQLAHRDGIANAFDWSSEPRTIEAKYGDGVADVRRLYEEISGSMSKVTPHARDYARDSHRALSA
ncbi:ParA family protein [Hyphomicrobium sp.]|uniref:ParA family protein n=1 Tax=Hyphomicrobium sp. TaxID=82 RepID=UPI0025C58B6E|nr:ParA family protein [Hyphomicrobium sp.]MCC7251298.1 ParA family protein [Hyphomicrobium sp.]